MEILLKGGAMLSGKILNWKVTIALVTVVLFPVTTTWAEGLSTDVRIITQQARASEVQSLQRRYERETGGTVVPILVKNSEKQFSIASELQKKMSGDLAESYSKREAAATQLEQFQGGDVVIAASLGAILLVGLIVLLVILLID
jgi:hypothetical protein